MAFNSNPPQQKYTATAGLTTFPFLFKIFVEGNLVVYNVGKDDDPEEAMPLLLGVDYTVTIDGDNGGSVELTTPTEQDDTITLYRRLDITRYVDYQTSGDLLANTLNADQDYQTYLTADLSDAVREELTGDGPGVPISDAVKKTGDTMTGTLVAPEVVVNGVPTTQKVNSTTSETGSSQIVNMVRISQADYDALTPISGTLYVVVG